MVVVVVVVVTSKIFAGYRQGNVVCVTGVLLTYETTAS